MTEIKALDFLIRLSPEQFVQAGRLRTHDELIDYIRVNKIELKYEELSSIAGGRFAPAVMKCLRELEEADDDCQVVFVDKHGQKCYINSAALFSDQK